MQRILTVSLLVIVASCRHDDVHYDPGPPPPKDHQQLVRTLQDRVLNEKYKLEAPSAYRFAAPVEDRVAHWHFEPEGQTHQIGYLHGWCVEYWVTPRYSGYPKQPESHRLAFFAEGRLRGLFLEGLRNAPLDLDKWAPTWADTTWQPAERGKVPQAGAPR